MKTKQTSGSPLVIPGILIGIGLLVVSCASSNVNPAAPRKQTGYVDLYADYPEPLCWRVERFKTGTNDVQRIFDDMNPLQGHILRLAFKPGHQKIRVTFIDLPVIEPAVIDLDVVEGKITLVQIKFIEAGSANIETKSTSVGGTAFGRYGRRTKFGSYVATMYRLTGTPQEAKPYQVKEQMPYAH